MPGNDAAADDYFMDLGDVESQGAGRSGAKEWCR
jgi:hypothetical protein